MLAAGPVGAGERGQSIPYRASQVVVDGDSERRLGDPIFTAQEPECKLGKRARATHWHAQRQRRPLPGSHAHRRLREHRPCRERPLVELSHRRILLRTVIQRSVVGPKMRGDQDSRGEFGPASPRMAPHHKNKASRHSFDKLNGIIAWSRWWEATSSESHIRFCMRTCRSFRFE